MTSKEEKERKILLFSQALRLEINEALKKFENRLKSLEPSGVQKEKEKCYFCHHCGEKTDASTS